MRSFTALAAVLAVLGTAAAGAQAPATDAAAPAAQPEKKVCRRAEVPTGSIMGAKRVCHTAAEWHAIDRQNDVSGDAQMQQLRGAGAQSGH